MKTRDLSFKRKSEKLRQRYDLPVAGDGLEVTVVSAERDVESDDGLAGLDEVEVLLLDAGNLGGVIVEELDLLEETGLVVLIELGAESGLGGEASVKN